ncbi:MATE family efflux transporter [Eubacteriales bacterium OttesenSCG-928-N13]|nr:MATE family efflux transporter [Eubacteriales bacterium OttesenSCG-928-N13]
MMQSIKKLFGPQDMTIGQPMRNLLMFSIPLLIGNFAQQMYSTVDLKIVSDFVGENAMGAVGVTQPIINLLIVVLMAIGTGAGIMVSQYFGAKDRKKLSDTIGTSITLIVVTSLVMSVIAIPLVPTLLRLINTTPEQFDMARDYLIIILIGLMSSGLFNILSGILRGLGDSVWPLVYLLLAVVLNLVLDVWFVMGLGMGVAGAAWATIISQTVSAVLCLIRLFQMKSHVDLGRHNLRINKSLTLQLTRLGLPAGATQAIMSMSMLLVQSLTNSMGAAAVNTGIAVMRVDGFAMMPNFTFGMALATFVGQNVGANRMDRVKQGSRDGLIMTLSVSVVLSLLLILFGHYLVGWFVETQLIIDLGTRAFRILAAGYIAVGISQVFQGIMRGAGDTMPSLWISLASNIIRIPLAYLLAYLWRTPEWPNGTPDALYVSLLICWMMGAVFTYLWYRRGTWKEKSLIRRPGDPTIEMPEIEQAIELE